MAERRALVAGATGLVGRALLPRLLSDPRWNTVTAVGRTAPQPGHPDLEAVRTSLEDVGSALAGGHWDDAFCCLGTTMKKAGSKAAFRAVDLEGVVAFARAARAGGARFFGLVSAAGAAPDSPSFYLRTKGEAEQAIEELGFPAVAIMRPGVLRGDRNESRPGERLAILASPLTDRLMVGPLAAYRSVAATTVADALIGSARQARAGVRRCDPAEMARLAAQRPGGTA